MDNNNQAPNPAQQPQSATVQNPPEVEPGAEDKTDKKMTFWLLGGALLIILVVGLLYWYLSGKGTARAPQAETAPSPAVAQKQENLDKELDSVVVNDVDSDFTELDKDLQNL